MVPEFSEAEIVIAELFVASKFSVYPWYKSVIVLLDLVILIPSTLKEASAGAEVWVKFLVVVVYWKTLPKFEEEASLGVTLIPFAAPWFAFKTKT